MDNTFNTAIEKIITTVKREVKIYFILVMKIQQ